MQRGILLGIILLILFIISGFILTVVISRKLMPLASTPKAILPEILSHMKIVAGQTIVELGAGDFRILISAWKVYKAKGVGYEISPILGLMGKLKKLVKIGPFAPVDINVENFFKANINSADKLFCHLNSVALYSLTEKLEKELQPNTELYTYEHPIPNISHIEAFDLQNGAKLFMYKKESFTTPTHSK
ncbi:MAG: hypothetical protein QY318_00400 [Candidatus Dojkabacteria bacterium]|nr:MAG: hypothetical protein QY318_00400 [Candidatus Dojkabacteria bacterium]